MTPEQQELCEAAFEDWTAFFDPKVDRPTVWEAYQAGFEAATREWTRLMYDLGQTYVAAPATLEPESEAREAFLRALDLAERIYRQADSGEVWGRLTSGGSAELDYWQDELEDLGKIRDAYATPSSVQPVAQTKEEE